MLGFLFRDTRPPPNLAPKMMGKGKDFQQQLFENRLRIRRYTDAGSNVEMLVDYISALEKRVYALEQKLAGGGE